VKIFATYRNADKLKSASEKFSANASNRHTSNITQLIINLEDLTSAPQTFETLTAAKSFRTLILINSAGVCLEGNSQELLEESLTVNCVSPAKINDILTALAVRENIELIIVNVSSGEGELIFLETNIQNEITLLETHEVRLSMGNSNDNTLLSFENTV
jgi:NAD(P)-dependent dehydrogenase (short-subunit alcohol dehydrogenase family)